MALLVLTDEQQCALSIQPLTAAGNPATVDGVPVWDVADDSLLSIEVSEDGLSAVVVTVGPLGTTQVNVSADADLGAGTRTITAVLDVQVVAAEAATLNITTGTPEIKP